MKTYVCPKNETRDFTYALTLRDLSTATPDSIQVITERNNVIIATNDADTVSLKAIGNVGDVFKVSLTIKYTVDAVEYKTYDHFSFAISA